MAMPDEKKKKISDKKGTNNDNNSKKRRKKKRTKKEASNAGKKNDNHTSGAKATVRGAVSIVNALATKKGATVGINLEVNAEVLVHPNGRGISVIRSNKDEQQRSLSSRLIQNTIRHIVPKDILETNKIEIRVSSEIPAGFGLKSSSSISSAVALAASRAFGLRLTDQQILLAGVEASITSKVSVTGAYDDACSCYYGGFNVTDNTKRQIIRHQRAPHGMSAVIFIPRNRKRGDLKKLQMLESVFDNAWNLAKQADYWKSMTINGLAVASVLGSDASIIPVLIEKGALAASVSGNGPAIAAVVKNDNIPSVKKVFSSMEGRILISELNNKKAEINDIL